MDSAAAGSGRTHSSKPTPEGSIVTDPVRLALRNNQLPQVTSRSSQGHDGSSKQRLQALAGSCSSGAPSRALIRRPNCSDSVAISGSQRPQRPPVGRSGGPYNGIPRGGQQWAVGRPCRVQPTYIQTACRKCAVGAWDAIGCHGAKWRAWQIPPTTKYCSLVCPCCPTRRE